MSGFRLCRELRGGHGNDVKCLCHVPGTDVLISGARDGILCVWDLRAGALLSSCPDAHGQPGGVSCSACATETVPECRVVVITGGYDRLLKVWELSTLLMPSSEKPQEPRRILVGHEAEISCCCTLTSPEDSRLLAVTGSWDMTARVWDVEAGSCLSVLGKLQSAVWSVLSLGGNRVALGSDDKSVSIWELSTPGKPVQVSKQVAHAGRVRCLRICGAGFISASNDCSVGFWSTADAKMVGRVEDAHSSYVYSCDVSGDGSLLCTTSEDRTAAVWDLKAQSAEKTQVISHPGSVWSCLFCPAGDLATGCADGVVRTWTSDALRVASDEVIAEYEASLVQASAQLPSGILPAALPASVISPASIVGKVDGEIRVFRDEKTGVAWAHRWVASSSTWEKIGEVVEGKKESGGELRGKKYDRIFDVELNESTKMKLGWNEGDNPYTAAQRFIEENELQQDFLQEIADYIMEQTGMNTAPQAMSTSSAVDPLTGGSRYVPGTSAVPPPIKRNASEMSSAPTFKYLPQTTPVSFPTNNKQGLVARLSELAQGRLASTEVEALSTAITTGNLLPVRDSLAAVVSKLLASDSGEVCAPFVGALSALTFCQVPTSEPKVLPDPAATLHQVLAIIEKNAEGAFINASVSSVRFLANCLANPINSVLPERTLVDYESELVDLCTRLVDLDNELRRNAAVSLVFNLCLAQRNRPIVMSLHSQAITQLLLFIVTILNMPQASPSDCGTCILALGTLAFGEVKIISLASELGCRETLEKWANSEVPTVSECAQEAVQLFRQ